ncbi:MAG: hypothetical protein RL385_2230 [Pseudomonadota bacterium]
MQALSQLSYSPDFSVFFASQLAASRRSGPNLLYETPLCKNKVKISLRWSRRCPPGRKF